MKFQDLIIDGKKCIIPVVVKSKDALIGYLSGFDHAANLLKNVLFVEENIHNLDLNLNSARFNGVIEDGVSIENMTDDQFEEFLISYVNKNMESYKEHFDNPENKTGILEPTYLDVTCPCGLGYYSFKHPKDVPETSLYCEVCNRPIILYTGHYDYEYVIESDK